MMESLNLSGNVPDDSDMFMILVMIGTMSGEHFLSRLVGIGSSSQYLSGQENRALVTSSSVTG